jgi:hypothetical protein
MIAFQCVWCSKKFQVPDNLAGKKIKCSQCDQVIDVPKKPQRAAAPRPRAPAPAPSAGGDPFAGLGATNTGASADAFAALEDDTTAEAAETRQYRRRGKVAGKLGFLLGTIGVGLLAWGVFLPAFRLPDPDGGTQTFTYWQLGTGKLSVAKSFGGRLKGPFEDWGITDDHLSVEGSVVLALAGLGLLLVMLGSFKLLWLVALGALGTVGSTMWHYQQSLRKVKLILADPESIVEGNFAVNFPYAAVLEAKLQLGWVALFAGGALMFLAACLYASRSRRWFSG